MGIRKITVGDVITMTGGTLCASCCQAKATTSLDGDPLCLPVQGRDHQRGELMFGRLTVRTLFDCEPPHYL